MRASRSVKLKRLHLQLGEVVYQLTKVNFCGGSPEGTWRPAINAYRFDDCVRVCVDLAGVEGPDIELCVEPRRIVIRGRRPPPEPEDLSLSGQQILAMEIDHGAFERELLLGVEIDTEKVTAEHKNGLLWIYVPLRGHA